ncbi:MAG: SusD/RagB family nutrient-binding outer membrane lipoprotein [Muribaculaceae bacterium]|nr:SusD/RagB family nutrient-binding outer membrane lipoprotein [Muribaculaceae bacterium]
MKKILLIASLFLASIVMVSCNDVLDDNVNPDKAHVINAKVGLPVLVFYAQQIVYDHAEYYAYFSQMLTTGGKSSIGAYSYKCEQEMLTMNRHPMWRRHFYDIGKNALNLVNNSHDINSPNYELIARTIMLMSTQLTTDAFGDMPRSQAYLVNAPTYDTQESIYAWMMQEIDDLIAMYEDKSITENENNEKISFIEDRVYGGDLEKWKGLVYAIKARLLLRHIPNVDRSPTMCQKIIDAADQAINQWRKGDLLYGAWFGNEPRYNFDGGTGTQNAVWSVAQPVINSWESRANLLGSAIPSKFFMVDLLGLNSVDDENNCGVFGGEGGRNDGFANDPRCALLMIARTGPSTASNPNERIKMRYLENNIGMGSSFKIANYPNLYMGAYAGANDCYNPIFTMEELYFIKAEALYWLGRKAEACALTREATEWNIQRHLEFFQKQYPNSQEENNYPGNAIAGGKPGYESKEAWEMQMQSFFDDYENYTTQIIRGREVTTYFVHKVTERGNKHCFFNPSEFTLSDLMQQKYIAMYLQPEQWTDMRRYHYSNNRNRYGIGDNNEIIYPTLRRPYNLYAAYWVDGLTEAEKENTWIQRLNYDPETEEKYNRSELQRLGAYKNYKWLQKPMIWAHDYGEVKSLTGEE